MSQRFAALEELGQQLGQLGEPRAGSRQLWPAISAAGLALIAVAVTAIVLLTSGTPAAYAGWSRVPRNVSAASISRADRKCYKENPLPVGKPVLAEGRGRSTAAIYVIGGNVFMCLYDPVHSGIVSDSMGSLRAGPGPRQLSVPYWDSGGGGSGKLPKRLFEALRHHPGSRSALLAISRFQEGDGYGYYALGQAGSDITDVTFAFNDHPTVVATVEHGWYFAWWPWIADPTSVTIQTSAGTETARMRNASRVGLDSPYPACKPNASACLFVKRPAASAQPTPVPTNVSRTVARTIRACDAWSISGDIVPAEVYNRQPAVSEVHGIFTAILTVANRKMYVCLVGGNVKNVHGFFDEHLASFGPVHRAPEPNRISVPYVLNTGFGGGDDPALRKRFPFKKGRLPTQAEMMAETHVAGGAGYGPYAIGEVGRGVSAIELHFANGKSVAATIRNGFYFAWWPWTSNPTTVDVTTTSGTVTSPVTGTTRGRASDLSPGCKPGSPGCVFVRTPEVS